MEIVQPIRDKRKIEEMKRELIKKGSRNYMLFYMGINTGLRIGDILNLKVSDVKEKSHISLREEKTNKHKKFKITNGLVDELEKYIDGMNEDEYLFQSHKGKNQPLSRIQAYRILNEAAKKAGINEVGTHTLRKTFGYHFYKMYKDVAILQEMFNHSSPSVTLLYIGINQDALDTAMDGFVL